MRYAISFDENAKQIMLAGLDMIVRDIGAQLSKMGGGAAQDAAAKIIAVRNVAIGIENAAAIPDEAADTPPEPTS